MTMTRRIILPTLIFFTLLISSCAPDAIRTSPKADSAGQNQTQPEVSFAPLQPGASIRFQKVSIEEGLSQSVVNSMVQDTAGFIWLGTQDGLNRYDGYNFAVYRPNADDPSSLSDGWVTSLFADKDGSVWVGTNRGGLNHYDSQTGKFTRYQNDPDNKTSLAGGIVTAIFRDKESTLWIGTSYGLNRFNLATNSFTRFINDENDPTSLSDGMVTSIFQDSRGGFWIGTGKGLNFFDPNTQGFKHYFSEENNASTLSYDAVDCITEDKEGNLWVGTEKGLSRFNSATLTFTRYLNAPDEPDSLAFDNINDLLVDSDGTLWIATDNGLDRYNAAENKFIHYHSDPLIRDSLSQNVLQSIFEDREGLLWFGTWGGGVNKYDRTENQFALYLHDSKNPDSLSGGGTFGTFVDNDGTIWTAQFGNGVDRFDPATGKFTHYTHDPKNPNSLNSPVVWDVIRDRQGILWFATADGLDEFDERKQTFTHHTYNENDPDGINTKNIFAVLEDSAGNLWIGSGRGLDRYERDTGKFIHYSDHEDQNMRTPVGISRIFEDSRGNLWLTTSVGLYRFDQKSETFAHFVHDKDNPNSLANDLVSWIYEDAQNNLWIGTFGGGLNKYNPATDLFNVYTEQQGLPNNFIYCIIPDNNGSLWLTTNYGISKFTPSDETFRNYTAHDGLQGNEFNSNACTRTADGAIYVGGVNGLNRFFPGEIRANNYLPPVVLTSLTSDGKSIPSQNNIPAIEELTVKYPLRSFEFELAALSFSQSNKNQYAYQLEGFDKDWYYAGTNRAGRYSNLPGGEYSLRVKASNADGLWSEEKAALKVTVIPPFWQTRWFYGLVALSILGVLFGAYRLRVHDVEAQKRELERQVNERAKEIEGLFEQTKELAILEERNRLARDLHDSAKQKAFAALAELGAARSLANGSVEKSTKHLQEAETLVGEVIQEITFLIQEIHPAALKEKGLASTLREYVFEWSNRTGIHVDLKIEGEQRLTLQIEQALYRSIQEALANVARHSAAKAVSLVLIIQPPGVNVSVSDDGRGFELNRTPNGMGLRSIRERVESVGGTFNVESVIGQGTRLALRIPMSGSKELL